MKAELPDNRFVLILGLSYPLEFERVAVKTEPDPGRWTAHLLIFLTSNLDDEIFSWVGQAYDFSSANN